jgi:uracil-DNA glycosylase
LEITNNQLQQIITLGERLQKYTMEVKKHNTKTLSHEEKRAYREEFMALFPKYF